MLFRYVRAIDRALRDLRDGKPMPEREACDMDEFEDIADLKRWISIETKSAIPIPEMFRARLEAYRQTAASGAGA